LDSPPGHHILLKYLGSALWGSMVYCLMASLMPNANPVRIAITATIVAASVEFSQLWHADVLDAVRSTRVGVLLIGKFFSWWDIAAYASGIALVALFDLLALRRILAHSYESRLSACANRRLIDRSEECFSPAADRSAVWGAGDAAP
jgi:hypothetical protein